MSVEKIVEKFARRVERDRLTVEGVAVADGKLSLTDRLVDAFPEYVPSDPRPACS